MTKKETGLLALAALAHFAVDCACFVLLWRLSGQAGWAVLLLGYDVLAFGLQPLLGGWQDAHPRLPLAALGCGVVLAGLALYGAAPALGAAAAVAAGLGNAAFHVGAGAGVLRRAHGRLAQPGVFVATGALGVALGKLTAGWWLAAALLALCGLALFAQARQKPAPGHAPMAFSAASARPESVVLALALGGILLRAVGGWTMPATGLGGSAAVLLPAVAAALGKAAGGFAGDRFGARRTGCAALAAAAVLVALQGAVGGWALLAAVALFNMTMPLALGVVATVLPQNPGLAFGLTTLALLLGTVPCFFWRPGAGLATGLTVALCVASIACLAGSTGNGRANDTLPKGENDEKTTVG